MTFRYYITFIFLFATLTVANGQPLRYADSLRAAGHYALAAVEYERCYYSASTRSDAQQALRLKAECYKATGRYADAATTLQRCASTYADHLQLTLCHYLAASYADAAATASQASLLYDTTTADLLLLQTLALNELRLYDSAYAVASRLMLIAGNSHLDSLAQLYASRPKLKDASTAQWLSLLPGLGHLYAGYPDIAASTFVINVGILAFAVWQIVDHCYLTAYIGGGGLLSTTYMGAMRSAAQHAERTNRSRSATFNNRCRALLIDWSEQP